MIYEDKVLTPFVCETEEPGGESAPETPEAPETTEGGEEGVE
jgi:hypothetical protein